MNKKEKRKRDRGRKVLHNISENTRKNGGKPQLPVGDGRTQGNPLRGYVTDVTTGEKARLGRILRNFRLRMRAPKGIPSGSRDHFRVRSGPLPVTSLPVALPRSTSANVALSVPIYY